MSTIVFTAILGNCDSLKPAPVGADRCVCFVTDPSAHADAKGWELREFVATNNRRDAWLIRALPHRFFIHDGDGVDGLGPQTYDRVIWIDASFTLTDLPLLLKDTRDAPISALRHHARRTCYQEGKQLAKIGQSDSAQISRQLRAYIKADYRPQHLSISCVIVRDSSEAVRGFNETWAAEFAKYPGDNTQLSLDYSAWANGLDIKALKGTRHQNPYATHDHTDHKRRRQPYDTELALT